MGDSSTEVRLRRSSTRERGKSHLPDRLDPEVARYATGHSQLISDPENRRLKRLIDQRVLVVMVFTYFLQTLDKGTVSFASIMHFPEDLNLHGQEVVILHLFTSITG